MCLRVNYLDEKYGDQAWYAQIAYGTVKPTPDYRTIEGIRYDAQMLEAADYGVHGKYDHVLSKDDVEWIGEFYDGDGRIGAAEQRTLEFIKNNYKLTSTARREINRLGSLANPKATLRR